VVVVVGRGWRSSATPRGIEDVRERHKHVNST
jgi:hypothetical protein